MRRYLVLILLAGACGSDDPAPTVTVVSASPDQLYTENDLKDDIRILVEYEDADGDLGDGIAQVHDCRSDTLVTELMIPAIAPDDVVKDGTHIKGSLDLYVNDVGAGAASTMPSVCDDLGVKALGTDETVFCVVLVDAAQHEGAGDCTPTIKLSAI